MFGCGGYTMENKRKNKLIKNVWFEKDEYNKLLDAIDNNEKEEVFDIMFKIYLRGDI